MRTGRITEFRVQSCRKGQTTERGERVGWGGREGSRVAPAPSSRQQQSVYVRGGGGGEGEGAGEHG